MAASAEDLVSLLVFARVVEQRSFTRAAAKLGISKSAASTRVSELEERMGLRLLHRTTRKLSVTSDGLALYERAARMAALADEATQLAAGAAAEPRGVLRVSAPSAFAELHLSEPIAAYLCKNPKVRLELLVSDRFVDLVEEGIDVAVRVSAGLADSSLVGKKLAEARTLACAAPAYLERRGTPETPSDLLQHDCLRYSQLKASDEWRFRSSGKSFSVPVASRLEASSGLALRAAALEGAGIAVLPSFMIADELNTGRLVQVLSEFSFVRLVIQAVYPPGKAVPMSVRAFVDLLASHLGAARWTERARKTAR